MCTSLTFQKDGFYCGRNLDLEYTFGEEIAVTPREYEFSFHHRPSMPRHFAMIGMAHMDGGCPLYAEAANEAGLYMAGLNFPGNAWYASCPSPSKENLAPYELIPRILGECATVEEARNILENVLLVDTPFRPGLPVAPLHWHLADARQALVIEQTRDGLHIYPDPAGVLTNNPPFPFHQENLRQYLNLTSAYPENRLGALSLSPFGQGMGSIGLPGDASPASRYVRAVFYKWNSQCQGENQCISQFFHILEGVSMIRGTVRTPENQCDMTTYSCCIHMEKGIYYYRTYENSQISAVSMEKAGKDGNTPKIFSLLQSPQIHWQT